MNKLTARETLNSNKIKVLFFGERNCQYSIKAYSFLVDAGFDVTRVLSGKRKDRLSKKTKMWSGEYIFCFRSYIILSKQLIDRASIAAINFHPATPEYPGSGGVNWALYDEAKSYGATAHIMNEKIDNGPIIECRRFPITPQDTANSLLARVHLEVFDLFVDIANGILNDGVEFLTKKIDQSKHEHWRGKARKISEIDTLQSISPTCSKEELERIIRATYTPRFQPFIELHGYKFLLKIED